MNPTHTEILYPQTAKDADKSRTPGPVTHMAFGHTKSCAREIDKKRYFTRDLVVHDNDGLAYKPRRKA